MRRMETYICVYFKIVSFSYGVYIRDEFYFCDLHDRCNVHETDKICIKRILQRQRPRCLTYWSEQGLLNKWIILGRQRKKRRMKEFKICIKTNFLHFVEGNESPTKKKKKMSHCMSNSIRSFRRMFRISVFSLILSRCHSFPIVSKKRNLIISRVLSPHFTLTSPRRLCFVIRISPLRAFISSVMALWTF